MDDKTAPIDPDKANPLAYLRQPRSNDNLVGQVRSPRDTPKGTKLLKKNSEEAILEIKVAKQLWWWLAPTIAAVFAVFMFPVAVAAMLAPYDSVANIIGFIILLACIICIPAAYFRTRVWLTITIHPDKIQVGSQIFDRKHASGFAIGYSLSGEDVLKNDFMDQSLGLSGLRLRYGRWGEDIPYLVNKYHSAEIVIWANEIIAFVGAPKPKQHAPEAGTSKDIF